MGARRICKSGLEPWTSPYQIVSQQSAAHEDAGQRHATLFASDRPNSGEAVRSGTWRARAAVFKIGTAGMVALLVTCIPRSGTGPLGRAQRS
jgi:hypothetical protein